MWSPESNLTPQCPQLPATGAAGSGAQGGAPGGQAVLTAPGAFHHGTRLAGAGRLPPRAHALPAPSAHREHSTFIVTLPTLSSHRSDSEGRVWLGMGVATGAQTLIHAPQMCRWGLHVLPPPGRRREVCGSVESLKLLRQDRPSGDVPGTLLKMLHSFINSSDTKGLGPPNCRRRRATWEGQSPAFRSASLDAASKALHPGSPRVSGQRARGGVALRARMGIPSPLRRAGRARDGTFWTQPNR